MTIRLRQSTASQEIYLGPFVDSTDGNTQETALSIANTDIKLGKAGGTTLTNKNSGGGTHIAQGVYSAVLDATDTDTVGPLVIIVHVTGALAVRMECEVLEEEVFDDLFAASAVGYLKPTTAGRDLDVSAGGEAGVDWNNIGSPTTAQNLSGTSTKAVEKDTALTEGYAADGAAPTLQQALFQIMQFLHEKSISGTTLTVKKLDGSTVAMTFTLNDATNPTSLTRAT
jgi:hypothetical protein